MFFRPGGKRDSGDQHGLWGSVVGARAMTSSSSPGISLKQEGISYLAACELPAVIVNMQRGGPGLGSIAASQWTIFKPLVAADMATIGQSFWVLLRCRSWLT